MSYIPAKAGQQVESTAEGSETGLVGTMTVEVVKLSDESVATAATTAGIVEVPSGSGIYYTRVTAPTVAGSYAIVWKDGSGHVASDILEVYAGPAPGTTESPNLITLAEMKAAMNISAGDEDPVRDAKYEQAIRYASSAVRKFADRAFGTAEVPGTRIYEYDSSGFMDIDDCMAVTAVAFIFGGFETPLEEFYWRPEPQEGPPYDYLTIPHWAGIYSPQMGFKTNLDVISKDRGWPGLMPTVKVTANWGWPTVPEDVKEATMLTAAAMAEKPDEYVAESIAGYSYTSANRSAAAPTAIPSRAQDILASYVRFQI
jgi:hypothetical protein